MKRLAATVALGSLVGATVGATLVLAAPGRTPAQFAAEWRHAYNRTAALGNTDLRITSVSCFDTHDGAYWCDITGRYVKGSKRGQVICLTGSLRYNGSIRSVRSVACQIA